MCPRLLWQIWTFAEVVDLLNNVIEASGASESIRKGQTLSGTLQDVGLFAMVRARSVPTFCPPHHAVRVCMCVWQVNLCRLYAKQGRYAEALSVIDAVDLDSSDIRVLAHVFKCFVTLCFYAGFAQLMLQRYSKASALFAAVLREYVRMQTPYALLVCPLLVSCPTVCVCVCVCVARF